jgi:hypothetical protein
LYVWGVKLEAKPAVISLFLLAKFGQKDKFKNHVILDYFSIARCEKKKK